MKKTQPLQTTCDADFIWRPNQKRINELMLEAGADPSGGSFYDDIDRLTKDLRGARVRWKAAITIGTARPEKYSKYSGDRLSSLVEDGIQAAVKRADADAKLAIIRMMLTGATPGREIDCGEMAVTAELA